MAQFIISGFDFTNQNNVPNPGATQEFSLTELELSGSSDLALSYDILQQINGANPEVGFNVERGVLTSARRDGVLLDATNGPDILSIGEVTWLDNGVTRTTVMLTVSYDDVDNSSLQFFFIGGDPVPEITNEDEFNAFIFTFTGSSPITSGPFAEGALIPVEDIQGVEIVDNTITGTINSEVIDGTQDDDILIGDAGDDIINALCGNDILIGGLGADTLNGGEGIDTASYSDSAEGITVFTSGRNGRGGEAQGDKLNSIENIIGSEFNDQIILNAGSPVDNLVNAGAGNDRIRERDGGTNTLNAEGGEDRVFGGANTDIIDGGDGEDDLFGGAGDDVIFGGGDASRDTLFGSSGDDTLNGGGGNDALRGNTGQDILNGEAGNDNLQGGNQNDILNGGEGIDVLDGGSGNDTLNGGAGNDRLTGGGSNDLFVFEIGSGTDRITDFNFGAGDQIDLADFALADFDAVIDLAITTGTDVRINFDSGDTLILMDTNISSLDAGDFILV